MKFLTDRKEIAQEININRTPVITFDIRFCMDGYENCYRGSKVQVATPSNRYPDMTARCTAEMFGDERGNECHDTPWMYKKIRLTEGGVCIKADFGMFDVLEMVDWSNTRTVKAGEKVIVMFRSQSWVSLRVMKVSDRVNAHCSTVATLEDIE